MAPSMTPSVQGITDGQVDKAVSVFRDQLRKHGGSFSVNAVQLVLGQDDLGPDLLTVFRNRVEAFTCFIAKRVTVNRDRAPWEMLKATGREQYTDKDVVTGMPRGTGEEVEVVFFKVGRYVNDVDLDKEYELRDLRPADPFSLGAVNEADPDFADEYPNGTHWQDADNKWCYAHFGRRYGDRSVDVRQNFHGWGGGGWFAGIQR